MAHECEATTGPVWSIAGDPRVTSVGRWLRDTHLDELPQLWNVLRGEMSLIGPRPERPEIAVQIERWLPEFGQRLAVRPGIAGLAQICLPPDADLFTVRRKLAYDLRYIQNIGPSLDARIAVATVFHFVGRTAGAISRTLAHPKAPPTLLETKETLPPLGLSLGERGEVTTHQPERGERSKVA
jgi:lipopolysaccharide/colanic/teichoic acid biosynthesis glycosyltransferase